VTAVEATDEFTVTFTLSSPLPELDGILAGPAGAVISPAGLASPDQLASKTFGSGPYQSTDFVPDEKVTFERTPVKYWLEGAGNLAGFTIFFADDQAAVNGLQSGDYDLVWTSLTPEQADTVASTGDISIYYYPLGGPESLGLRITHQKLNDIRVRQAIAYAIDRQPLADAVFGGSCKAISQPMPPDTPLYVEGYDPYPFNPDKAKELLAEADAVGMPIELYTDGRPSSVLSSQAVQQMLNDVGFNASVIPPEAGAGGIFADGKYDGFWAAFPQQDHLLGFLNRYIVTGGRFQLAAGEDQKILELMDQVRVPGISDADAADIYQQIGKEITDLAVLIAVCLGQSTILADSNIANAEDAFRWTVFDMRFIAVKK
jgi:peptide/nickel transport system substrate-binding protein